MVKKNQVIIELFYTLTCPNCKILQQMLDEALSGYGDKFVMKKTMANGPIGMFKTMKLGIHTVPTLLIDTEIAFKYVPTKMKLIEKLNRY
jgi:predicted DsbA family dithiol-disulfide isomerase